jgi:hypothetical protein
VLERVGKGKGLSGRALLIQACFERSFEKHLLLLVQLLRTKNPTKKPKKAWLVDVL